MRGIKAKAKWLGLGALLFILAVLLLPAGFLQAATMQGLPVANILIDLLNKVDADRRPHPAV